jgi:signal transduction histidine kinase
MDLAVVIVTQVVNWPLAVLTARRAASGQAPLASWATVALLVSGAVAVWDPDSALILSRVFVAVSNASLALLFAVYPNGRFVPRWIVVPAVLEIALQAVNVASGFALESGPWWPMHFAVIWAVLIIGGQIHRYRLRSSVDERERTRWPLLTIVLMIVAFSVWSFVALGLDAVSTYRSQAWLANLLFVLPGVGFAVGLLAPRLLRVDRALRWTISWGLWSTAMSALAWAVSVALVALPAAPRSWLTAAIVGLIAPPALWATRRLADVTVYGRRPDPLRTLEHLGDRLAASVDPRTVPVDIVATVTSSLGLAGAALLGAPALSATAGAPVDAAEGRTEYPIRYQGEQLGLLVVVPRPGDSALTAHDRAVLTHICGQAAPALHSARVVRDLIDARSRIVFAREEERKRLRRDLHDDLAPTFAGLGLAAAAVETFSRLGDERAADAAARLVAGLHAATRQLRDVAYDLRPPVLDDRGLVAAIEERLSAPGSVPRIRVDAPPERLELPAAVESAALRIVQEAVTNVRRHAAASICVITVTLDVGMLRLSIADDGIGIPDRYSGGVGMGSMAERASEVGGELSVAPAAMRGTVVMASLPVAGVPLPEEDALTGAAT